jgi:hypothetical protein
VAVNLAEIETAVAAIPDSREDPFEYLYALVRAYGLAQASISRLKNGSYDKSEGEDERLWKGKVYFRHVDEPVERLLELIEETKVDEAVLKQRPRFLIVRNDDLLLAWDLEVGTGLNVDVAKLANHAAFFLPWAGIEKTAIENVNIADVKAAEKMAKLYDEIVVANEIEAGEQRHDLNIFFSRLLFCFFAEDTGVFEPGSFTNAIGSSTSESGDDLDEFFDRLFAVLNTAPGDREGVPQHLAGFGYVNGALFDRSAPSPRFTAKARSIVLECGRLDWGQINPDIFGSMMQGIARSEDRESLGMHYTSVENIMKVIRPLFLDDLEERFRQASDSEAKLNKLLKYIAGIQIFDPACGSGNFLVIAYKELRRLEHKILQQIQLLNPQVPAFKISGITLENFYGIEIEDFPSEIAALSLWLAKHQLNREFEDLFGSEIPLIPLKEGGNIVNGNAVRIGWDEVCDPDAGTATFLLGNPPYVGSSMQGPAQKQEFVDYFGSPRYPKNLDYISLWFFKGAECVGRSEKAALAFVSTNSISQGDHTGLMWPRVLESGVEIFFAYASFLWTNQARGKAGVTCTVVGLRPSGAKGPVRLFDGTSVRKVDHINPYLMASASDTIVHSSRRIRGGLPPMVFGSKPTDGGFLNMSPSERDELVGNHPEAKKFVRKYVGASEYLNGSERYCVWVTDAEASKAERIPPLARRFEKVEEFRKRSSTVAQGMADRPYRFLQRAHKDTSAIIVPSVSSERREYIPIGFVGPDTVISNAANAVYDAEPWLFGLVQSRMHMVWVRAVAGRMKTDYRYSAVLVYNTFPVPRLSEVDREQLAAGAIEVLTAREREFGKTLAELYDPDKMPAGLRQAHEALDGTVDRIYREKPFASDEDRLELLFEMYEKAVDEERSVA